MKKGRACYVNDFTIRLDMSDAIQKSEVIKMDNMNHIEAGRTQEENKVLKLYFNARNWKFNKDCSHNVGTRSFMQGPDGGLAEAYMIGNWNNDWTEIVSDTLLLPKDTDCSFTFWLNGGENDRHDEVCRFEIIFNNDWERRYTYNLNRNYIQPLKKLNGWELYEIPFHTLDNEYTQLKFIAQKAYMTVLAAKDAAAYGQYADTPDPFEDKRPQRHNLVFGDGFPKNNWYSTEQMVAKYGMRVNDPSAASKVGKGSEMQLEGIGVLPAFPITNCTGKGGYEIQLEQIRKKLDEVNNACEDIARFDVDGLVGRLRGMLEDAFGDGEDDPDLAEIISDAVESIQDTLGDTIEAVQDALEEVADRMEELKDALLDE